MTVKKVIAIGGIPGTGKSTLMKAFMSSYGGEWIRSRPVVPLDTERSSDGLVEVLGKYDEGEVFSGTDRLSMSVQTQAKEYLQSEDAVETIVFEGDRLFNGSFLNFIIEQGISLEIIILNVDSVILKERYEERGSNQSEKFIQGRVTKYDKILSSFEFMPYITEFFHMNEEDTRTIVKYINLSLGE